MTDRAAPVTTLRDAAALQAVFGLGLVAFLVGVLLLSGDSKDATVGAALAGAVAQLPATAVPAVVIALLAALNLAAGAVIVRAIAGQPYQGWAVAVLAGLAGAVVLDTALMGVLGAFAVFRWPVLLAANLAVLAGFALVRPFFATARLPRPSLPGLGLLGWVLVGCVWAVPVLVQLASPVVPSNDVGPNHIAPVEHLLVFGSLSPLDLTVSPVYGPSRIFLGYQGLLGTLATISGIEAATAIAAFILPLAVLLAVGGCALAGAMAGRRAAAFALVLLPLSVPFLRLTDVRGAVVAFPLVALTLCLMLVPLGSSRVRRAAVLAVAAAACIYVHPLMGLFNVSAVLLAALVWPRRYAGLGLAAAIAAVIAAGPQWAAMLGLPFASATALLALPAAGIALYVLAARIREPAPQPDSSVTTQAGASTEQGGRRSVAVIAVSGLAVGAALLAVGLSDASNIGQPLTAVLASINDYAVLLAGAVIGFVSVLLLRWNTGASAGIGLLVVGIGAAVVGSVAGIVVTLIAGSDAALAYEVSKTAAYIAPTLLALMGAVGLAVVWARTSRAIALRFAVVATIVVLAAAPVRIAPVTAISLGEHRLSETAAITLGIAGHGYWQSFPDARWTMDADQREVIGFLRDEIAAGRLTATTDVLQVTQTWQGDGEPSYAMSLSTFAGVVETIAAADGPRAQDSVGGRMLHLEDLPTVLDTNYPYVVAQTRGLPGDVLATLKERGYETIFENKVAQVLRLPD